MVTGHITYKCWCTNTQKTLSGWTPSRHIFSLCLSPAALYDAQYTHGTCSLNIWIFTPVQRTLVDDILNYYVILNVTVTACYCLQGYVTVWKMRLSLIRRMDYSQVILKQKKQTSFSKQTLSKKWCKYSSTSNFWYMDNITTSYHATSSTWRETSSSFMFPSSCHGPLVETCAFLIQRRLLT